MRYPHVAIILALCISQASLASPQICADFQVGGVKAILLRARDAERAQVIVGSNDSSLKVCGVPSGGAKGYHPADPNWRETPPQ